ncbi:PilZ domain-containing protein [Paludisphaera mucosa]|uniref:PilZ domain-containing protein n=1 Tax=Paludisphaera mucosa TaxID=3030827 RepID=A0ABT6FGP0_9BACT|nr:PilZ domain-containing protein [Paludisphaera mucosa]MDG3006751.1 PilZ domain-containing protein [Paludisphaera mucosa]
MNVFHHRLRGDAPQVNVPVLDRRCWPRGELKCPDATLHWVSGFSESSLDARVVDLSQGGAGLLVPLAPPRDASLHLVFPGHGGTVVEGWAIACREQLEGGGMFVHMKFRQPCPERLLRRLLGDPSDEI